MNEHVFANSLGYLLQKAERLLLGPKSLELESKEFWGWRYLTLRVESMPRINGVIETRIVYANPVDVDQSTVILRQAYWNAELARTTLLQALRHSDEVIGREPEILVSYAQATVEWVNVVINRFDKLSVPLKLPQTASKSEYLSYFAVERQDGTVLNISWGKGMPHPITLLDQAWDITWGEMKGHFQEPLGSTIPVFIENW